MLSDLQSILATVDAIASEVIAPNAVAVDKDSMWPEENLRTLQAAGLGGLVIPNAYGGLGHGLLALSQVCEILGRYCPSTALCYGMHCVGSAVIAAKPSPEQVERYLRPIAAGKHLTTLSLSEPGTGVHFYIPQTQLVREDGGYRLNGAKSFVTNGGHADSYVMSAASADADAPPGMFSCILVPSACDGLTWGPHWVGLGMRGNSSRTVELSNLFLPRTHLLGIEGDEIWYMFYVVTPYFLTAMAGTYLGIASAAFDEARQSMGTRHYDHSGSTPAHSVVLQHRLGTLWAQVERTRQLLYSAGRLGDNADPNALPSILAAKAEVGHCAVEVVNEAMTLAGGRAYRDNSRLEQLMRDARAAHIMAPTTDLLYTWLGRALLDLPLIGD